MRIFGLLLLSSLVAVNATNIRACDLCGCFTPQLEAMPDMEHAASPSWGRGFYGAIGEQFTRFATVQVDGREVEQRQ